MSLKVFIETHALVALLSDEPDAQRISDTLLRAKKRYTIVEKAGYVGECDMRSFDKLNSAIEWCDSYYQDGELESLNVGIAVDLPDGSRTYEW